ncbi:MAG: ATP synthase F1 subunit gamma [Candidatus Omnitrophica bacterium]|nr:ATP synthase F1 subunit gamma [Candidatus Omnitrophota bacterium]
MSGQLRNLKKRIRNVENTKKITRAMEMVATAKFQRFQTMTIKSRTYINGLENLLKRVSQDKPKGIHPLLCPNQEEKTALILFTSDTGLCGSFNNELIDKAREFLVTQKTPPCLIGIGRNGVNRLKRIGHQFDHEWVGIRTNEIEKTIVSIKSTAEKIFLENTVGEIHAVYARCLTSSAYNITIEQLLPLTKLDDLPDGAPIENTTRYIYAPSREAIFKKLIPLFFEARVRQIFLESYVSEQIARMRAMHQATQNASEMIDELVLKRNKARQAAITREIIEVVSGSHALKDN